jgi:hypothetical protein
VRNQLSSCKPLQQHYFSEDVITVYKVLEISYVYLILPRSHICKPIRCMLLGARADVLSSLGRLAEVTSKLIDRRSSTFNWVKFLSSVISGSPLLDTTACASMWSARGHLSARINWLSCDDRRTPPPWGRQVERSLQEGHAAFSMQPNLPRS